MIFIDTGAFLARYLARDQYHRDALAAWELLGEIDYRCYTSNFVLDETLTLLGRRASYAFAAERARQLFASRELTILRPDLQDETAAVELFEKFADQRVSFTDCVSFALMRRHRLKLAFCYDGHFEQAGFHAWPEGGGGSWVFDRAL